MTERLLTLLEELSNVIVHLESAHRTDVGGLTVRLEELIYQIGQPADRLRILLGPDGTEVGGERVLVDRERRSAIAALKMTLERANLQGLEFPVPVPAQLLHIWLTAVVEGNRAYAAPVFREVGLRGLSKGFEPPFMPPPDTPQAGPITTGDLDALARELAERPTPERGTAVPTPALNLKPLSNFGDLGPPSDTTPSPTLRDSRDALLLLVEAADAFEHILAASRADQPSSSIGIAHLETLERAADRLEDCAANRPDLAVQAHRIRARGRPVLSPGALHAAGTSLLTSLLSNSLEVPAGSRRRLGRASLFAHLPVALAGRPPSPARIPDHEAKRFCQSLGAKLPKREDEWLELGWVVAAEHRMGLSFDGGSPTHSAARVVGVAAGYDALVSTRTMSTSDALKTLAQNASTSFDPHYVTVLTTLIAAFR